MAKGGCTSSDGAGAKRGDRLCQEKEAEEKTKWNVLDDHR